MPRGPRLDLPSALHHVMVRGLDRQTIFRDDEDRKCFLDRLATVCRVTGLRVLACALLPNHAHFLVRTGNRPLSAAMRSLLTGYAGAFNRRHRRVGHLFQNRYKSILVEEEPYLLELIRYIHLNPVRLRIVEDLDALERYPWSGHGPLVGRASWPWQAVADVLRQFGPNRRLARRRYREFVTAGVELGHRPELQGGGLVRSIGGWEKAASLRRGREAWSADERILGGSDFVEDVRQQVATRRDPWPRARAAATFPVLVKQCAGRWRLTPEELTGGGRRESVAQARAVVSYLAVRELGLPILVVARNLSVSPTAVRTAVARGEAIMARQGITLEELLPGRTGRSA